MSKKKTSEGSEAIRLIVTILIAAAILAGFYFWNTFQKSKMNVAPKVIANEKEARTTLRSMEEIRSGPVMVYYNNGKVKMERNFKEGKLEGPYKIYYDNGVLKEEGSYKNDKLDGVLKRYYKSGKLKAEEVYQDNLLLDRKTFDDQ